MPKRKHGHGGPPTLGKPEVTIPKPEVTDQDRRRFGSLVLWSVKYVNYLYGNCGIMGGPITKRWTEAMTWHHSVEEPETRLVVRAAGLAHLEFSEWGDESAGREYERQQRLGVELTITRTTTPYPHLPHDIEHLSLGINADEKVAAGTYDWTGSRLEDRPAPDVIFDSIQQGHDLGISARAAMLLGEFRALALSDAVAASIDYAAGLGNRAAIEQLPEALRVLPDFS